MKKRILLLIVSILFLCGCDVTYTLDVKDFVEAIDVVPTTNSDRQYINMVTKNQAAFIGDVDFPEDGSKANDVEYYAIHMQGDGLLAKYQFNQDNYKFSRAAHYCFPSLLVEQDRYVHISTLNKVECFNSEPDLDKITINLKVPYEVEYNNADSVNKNVYTWVFEKEGSPKSIDIKYKNPKYSSSNSTDKKDDNNKDNKKDDKEEENKENGKTNPIFYAIVGLFFVALFGIIIVTSKLKKY